MMRVLSVFSGIGGFDLAAEWAGHQIVGQVEIDPFCVRVLERHWPDVPRMRDVREVRGDEFGAVDLVCGGFPCQPASFAGQRRGTADDRWLWPEMARIVRAARPAWVLGENVAGLVSLALDGVLADLEGLGYTSRATVVPACAVNAPHRRDRVWIVAHADADRERRRQPEGGFEEQRRWASDGGPNVADAAGGRIRRGITSRQGGQSAQRHEAGGAGTETIGGLGGGIDGISARLDRPGWGLGWENEISRTTIGDPNRVRRLKALGNAVVPQVAFEFLRLLTEGTSGH